MSRAASPLTATSTDAQSGIASTPSPALGRAGRAPARDSTYVHRRRSRPGRAEPNVTATNGAGTHLRRHLVHRHRRTPTAPGQLDPAATRGACAGWYTSSPRLGHAHRRATAAPACTRSATRSTAPPRHGDEHPLHRPDLDRHDHDRQVPRHRQRRQHRDRQDPARPDRHDRTRRAPTLAFAGSTNAAVTGSTVYVRTGVARRLHRHRHLDRRRVRSRLARLPRLRRRLDGRRQRPQPPVRGRVQLRRDGDRRRRAERSTADEQRRPRLGTGSTFTVVADTTAPASSALCDGGSCAPLVHDAPGRGRALRDRRRLRPRRDPVHARRLRSRRSGQRRSTRRRSSIAATTTVKFRAYDRVGNEESVGSRRRPGRHRRRPTRPALTLRRERSRTRTSPARRSTTTRSGANSGSFTVDGHRDRRRAPGSPSSPSPPSPARRAAATTRPAPTPGSLRLDRDHERHRRHRPSPRTTPPAHTAGSTFTLTPDTTAPTSQSVALTGGPWYTSALGRADARRRHRRAAPGSTRGSRVVRARRGDAHRTAPAAPSPAPGRPSRTPTRASSRATATATGCTISDHVGNTSQPSAATATAKVDTTAPGSALARASARSRTRARPGRPCSSGPASRAASRSRGTAADAQSGIASTSYPALGPGWSRTGSDYTFTGVARRPRRPERRHRHATAAGSTSPAATPSRSRRTAPRPRRASSCDARRLRRLVHEQPRLGHAQRRRRRRLGRRRDPLHARRHRPRTARARSTPGRSRSPRPTTVKYRAYRRGRQRRDRARRQLVQIDTTAPAAPTLALLRADQRLRLRHDRLRPHRASRAASPSPAPPADVQSGVASHTFPTLGVGLDRRRHRRSAPYEGAYSFDAAARPPAARQNVTATQRRRPRSRRPRPSRSSPTRTAPASRRSATAARAHPGSPRTPVAVALGATDGGSGVDDDPLHARRLRPDVLAQPLYVGPLSIAATTTVKFRAYDRVGNEERSAPPSSASTRRSRRVRRSPSTRAIPTRTSPARRSTTTRAARTPARSPSTPRRATPSRRSPDRVPRDRRPDRRRRRLLAAPTQAAYDWTTATGATGAQTVTAHNGAGNTATSTFTLTPDTTAPGGHSLDRLRRRRLGHDRPGHARRRPTARTAAPGIDASSRVYERDEADAHRRRLRAFGRRAGRRSPTPDTTVASGFCYRYRLRVSDASATTSTASAATGTVQVDTSAPTTPGLAFGSLAAAYEAGGTVWYRPDAASASFTVTASATDPSPESPRFAFPGRRERLERVRRRLEPHVRATRAARATPPIRATSRRRTRPDSSRRRRTYTVSPDAEPPTGTSATVTGGYAAGLSIAVDARQRLRHRLRRRPGEPHRRARRGAARQRRRQLRRVHRRLAAPSRSPRGEDTTVVDGTLLPLPAARLRPRRQPGRLVRRARRRRSTPPTRAAR